MSEEHVPADYTEMDLVKAERFDKKVKENFMPAIISTVRQITEEELNRMKSLRDRSLKENAKAYNSPDVLEENIKKANISNFRIICDRAGL